MVDGYGVRVSHTGYPVATLCLVQVLLLSLAFINSLLLALMVMARSFRALHGVVHSSMHGFQEEKSSVQYHILFSSCMRGMQEHASLILCLS